jgi:hypothetical protein
MVVVEVYMDSMTMLERTTKIHKAISITQKTTCFRRPDGALPSKMAQRVIRVLSLIVFVAFAGLCFGDVKAPITKEERVAIEAVIKMETGEKILSLYRLSADTVLVRTGDAPLGQLAVSGQSYTLKRTKTGWEITKRGRWLS